ELAQVLARRLHVSQASWGRLRAALGELDRLLRSAAHIAKDVPHVHGGLDALVREAADLPCHHGKPLAVLAGADRLDGRVEREHVRLVRQVLHRVGAAGVLRGSLVQLRDPTRDPAAPDITLLVSRRATSMRAQECASRRTSSRCPAIDASASETTVAAPPIRFSAAPRSPPAISSATSAIRDSGATRTLPSTSTTT